MNLIEYILKNKNLKQKDLAESLGVSRAQISKWKSGESIPYDREKELTKLAGLFGFDPEWAVLVGTEENSQAWADYMFHMNHMVEDTHGSIRFEDEAEIYTQLVLKTLHELGLNIPENAPVIDEMSDSDEYNFTEFDKFIFEYLTNYGAITTWCSEYIYEDHDDLFEIQDDIITHYPIYLTLQYIDKTLLEKNGFDLEILQKKLSSEIESAKKALNKYCLQLTSLNISIKTDYFDLVNKHPYQLDDTVTFSNAMYHSPNPFVAIEEYFSFPEKMILAEIRDTKALLEDINLKLDKLSSS